MQALYHLWKIIPLAVVKEKAIAFSCKMEMNF